MEDIIQADTVVATTVQVVICVPDLFAQTVVVNVWAATLSDVVNSNLKGGI